MLALVACKGPAENKQENAAASAPAPAREDELFRVGELTVHESDLARLIDERYGGRTDEQTRQAALDELVNRARHARAGLDAGLLDDPVVRAELGRLLAARLRETKLAPQHAAIATIPEERLRELYQTRIASFQAPEKRQVAVLWLDPGSNPEKSEQYAQRLAEARTFAVETKDILDHPEQGFSVLSVDYSEHSASRFRGGIVGWMQREGGFDAWTKAVAEIAFSLNSKGDLSEVVTRPEGVFLVRLADLQPALTRSFESVAAELERSERDRLRKDLEARFEQQLESDYPVTWPEARP